MLSAEMSSIIEKLANSYVRRFYTIGGGSLTDGRQANSVVYDGGKGLFYSISTNNEPSTHNHKDPFLVQVIPVETISSLCATMDKEQVVAFIKSLDDDGVFTSDEHKQTFIDSLKAIDGDIIL